MIKAFLLLLFSFFISLSASAQWWKKKPQVRLPLLQQVSTDAANVKYNNLKSITLPQVKFARTQYSFDAEETLVMKDLYHTLRFRMYPEAIRSFNRLVDIYIEESRYSEAKWYLLQCNYFGHKNNDTNVIVASLISLGMLKADIGEYVQAKEDLLEAQGICTAQGRSADVAEIDKKLELVEAKRFANIKNDVRYAEVIDDKKG